MSQISRTDFQNIVHQLVNLEEKQQELVKELFPDPSPERARFQQLLAQYIGSLDEFIKSVSVLEKETNFPLVTLDSIVEAQELDSGESYRFHLVLPFQAGLSLEDVSILSPLGQALLLKTPGETIMVKAPGGTFHYKILAIHFSGSHKSAS